MRYNNNRAIKPGKPPTEVIVMPSEPLEVQNDKWETDLRNKFGFSEERIKEFKRVSSRSQFLSYCTERGYVPLF